MAANESHTTGVSGTCDACGSDAVRLFPLRRRNETMTVTRVEHRCSDCHPAVVDG